MHGNPVRGVGGGTSMALSVEAGDDFNFRGTIDAHGWCVLAPFSWDGGDGVLGRVELLSSGRVVRLAMKAGPGAAGKGVTVAVTAVTAGAAGGARLSAAERAEVAAKVRRMLRMDEDFTGFWKLCRKLGRRELARRRLGRMLRCPSVFEDVVKVMLTVNTNWRRTRAMVENLVAALGEAGPDGARAFPAPAALAAAGEGFLRDRLRYGYRSRSIAELAQRVASGEVDLEALLDPRLSADEVRRRLLALRGIGPYAAATAMALVGHYTHLPYDSDMIKYVAAHTGEAPKSAVAADKLYLEWGQWRYLGYLSGAYGW